MLTAPKIDPPAFEIEANDVYALDNAHYIFNDERRDLWPLADLGFVEESAIGGPLVMCGGCGNVVSPTEECSNCGDEPGSGMIWCPADDCEGGVTSSGHDCRRCDGSGEVDAPLAYLRAEFDASLDRAIEALTAGIDLRRLVASPWPVREWRPLSLRGLGGAA